MKRSIVLLLLLFFGVIRADITGLTTNGKLSGSGINTNIYKITAERKPTNAQVKNESILLSGSSGRILGNTRFENCVIKAMSSTSGKVINFDTRSSGNYTAVHPYDMVLTDGTIFIYDFAGGRKNMAISELSNGSSIVSYGTNVKTGADNGLYVYTENGARLVNCRFDNIKNIETQGPFEKFYNVDFVNTVCVMLNWEYPRIDRFSINVESTSSGWDSWIGSGNGGRNSIYDWNPRKVNINKIIHQGYNNRYYMGYTASFKFVDKSTNKSIDDVYVGFYDNASGAMGYKTEFLTNTGGVLNGTYDTQFETNTSINKLRPTLFFLKHRSKPKSSTVNTGLHNPNTSYRYDIENISYELDIRSYAHQSVPRAFDIDHEYGKLDENNEVKEFYNYYLKPDNSITNDTASIVASYTKIDDLNQLFDVAKLAWRNNRSYPLLEVDGGIIKLPAGYNLRVNPNAGAVYSVAGNTITVKSNFIAKSDKFYWIQAPSGTISFSNGGYIDAKYTDQVKTAYVRLKYFKPDDRIRIYTNNINSPLYDREGQGGFAYSPHSSKYKVRMDSRNGTEAMQEFQRKVGTENEFYINFTASANFFGVDDRIELYGTNQKVVDDVETKSNELNDTELKIYQLLKEIQHVKTK
jgi:hypothetical protein